MTGKRWNVEHLIQEVEKRPELYDTTSEEYSDRDNRARAWREICTCLVTNWDELSPGERTERARDAQRKWKSLRDCFHRELKFQRRQKPGTFNNKKKYLYFDLLLFLLPKLDEHGKPRHLPELQVVISNDEERRIQKQSQSDSIAEISHINLKRKKTKTTTVIKRSHFKCAALNSGLAVSQKNLAASQTNFEDDDDRMFLLSMLPSFKKLREDIKFSTRIEMMQTMQRALILTNQPHSFLHNTESTSSGSFFQAMYNPVTSHCASEQSEQAEDGSIFVKAEMHQPTSSDPDFEEMF